jgi:hypothetical protein
MKITAMKKRGCRKRSWRKAHNPARDAAAVLEKVAPPAPPVSHDDMKRRIAALLAENRRLRRRQQVIRIENVNIQTLVTKN